MPLTEKLSFSNTLLHHHYTVANLLSALCIRHVLDAWIRDHWRDSRAKKITAHE